MANHYHFECCYAIECLQSWRQPNDLIFRLLWCYVSKPITANFVKEFQNGGSNDMQTHTGTHIWWDKHIRNENKLTSKDGMLKRKQSMPIMKEFEK